MTKGIKSIVLELKDVAHILGCSPADVVGLVSKGKLKAIKRGQYWVFHLSDVQSYKEEQTSASLTKKPARIPTL